MKKIINIVLITLLITSNIFISPVFAQESNETSSKEQVNLHLPDSDEDLKLYQDEALEDELASIDNDSSAILLEEFEDQHASLVEVEVSEEEVIKGYINSEAVANSQETYEAYKLYAKEESDDIPLYIDDTLEDTLYEVEEETSVLVNEADLEELDDNEDYIHISLNPETEEIPEELEATYETVEDIQGFVEVDRLVSLEDEEAFLSERRAKAEEAEAVEEEKAEEKKEKEEVSKERAEENDDNDLVKEEKEAERAEKSTEKSAEKSDEEAKEEQVNEPKALATFAMTRKAAKESKTSRLGHIRGGDQPVYKTLGGKSFKATSKYQNKVYYIKREAKMNGKTYYLLSTSPSDTKSVLGWMEAKDVSTHTHKGYSKDPKALQIKGHGKATSKAWGGSKDTVHASLKKYKGDILHVNLTEKVGNNTWYRGKLNDEGKNVWVHSSQTEQTSIKEESTSLLGHVRGGGRPIYKTIGGQSFKASAKYQNQVYYIKRKAEAGSQTYYLLSQSPSATKGVVGWMKAKDLSTHTHKGYSKSPEALKIKGTGKATSKAWGGSKDTVYSSMSKHKGKTMHVNLTEKVGNNTWYRGKLNGKGSNIWLHSSNVEKLNINESKTSRLGHMRGGDRTIYNMIGGSSFKATAKHRDQVYYIKREATYQSDKYYLLSTQPSATKGVLGWVKAKDLSTHPHTGVSKTPKTMEINGKGKATTKAWGGSKDTVHSSMKNHKDKSLHVNLIEKVGKNTWYRGKIDNKGNNIWLHSSSVNRIKSGSVKDGLIVLDAGHGGHDGGASANGIIEKDVVLDVTLRVEKILKARGYDVLLTRRTDKFIELSERSNIANRNNANAFLSIHANAGGGIGTETWWYNRNNAVSSKLFAQTIQNAVINTTNARDRGVKHGNLSVNRESKMTSALLEIGFVDSLTDARNLKKASYKNKIAKGVADGFDNYYK